MAQRPTTEYVDLSPPYCLASGASTPRLAARPHDRRVSHPPRDQPNEGKAHLPPVWQDGTERPIHRPQDPEEQQESYSGKKKCHTIKYLLVIDEAWHRCFLSDTYEGKAHDKSPADLVGYILPVGSSLYQDLGFQGFILAGVTIVPPKKNPRGGELSPPENTSNCWISLSRIRGEHAIGRVKRYRIVKDKIRLFKDGIRDAIMETCCSLHNFCLQYRP